jgi:hypothetical protein
MATLMARSMDADIFSVLQERPCLSVLVRVRRTADFRTFIQC